MADCRISEFMEMQRAQAKAHGWDKNRIPSMGHRSLLWCVGEMGEMIDIIKKKGHEAIMDNENVRANFVEETADVFMYLFDVMEAFGITPEEFSDAYIAKFERNMKRTWEENKIKYENKPGGQL